jgi:hypothetical protein
MKRIKRVIGFNLFWLQRLAASGFGLGAMFGKTVSDFESSQHTPAVPSVTERKLRALLLLRGITHNNNALGGIGERLAKELLHLVSRSDEPRSPDPIAVWTYEKDPVQTAVDYVQRSHPFIIKGFPFEARRWTVDYFLSTFPSIEVLFTDPSGRHFEKPLSYLADATKAGERIYLANSGRVFLEKPGILDELNLEQIASTIGMEGPHYAHQLFLGAYKQTGSPFHCAPNSNIFFQMEGTKKWTFVDPIFSAFLYPYLSDLNTYQASVLPLPYEEERLRNFPLYQYCPRYEALIEPGDVLYNPRWWYHCIENMSERTVAVATRWDVGMKPRPRDTNRLYSALEYTPKMWWRITRALAAGEPFASYELLFEIFSHDNASYERFAGAKLAWGIEEPAGGADS